MEQQQEWFITSSYFFRDSFRDFFDSDAQTFGSIVRSHWGIEYSLHGVLEVPFREDESRIRKGKAQENFAVLRHIASTMIKKVFSSKKSIKSKRLGAGWDDEYLMKVLAR